MMMHSTRLNEMKNRLSVHPEPAKKAYRTPVRAMVPAYMAAVEMMRIHCQRLESDFSQFSRQVSDHEWAKSTRRTKPRSMKIVAPIRET
jgi:hypothetical protein